MGFKLSDSVFYCENGKFIQGKIAAINRNFDPPTFWLSTEVGMLFDVEECQLKKLLA